MCVCVGGGGGVCVFFTILGAEAVLFILFLLNRNKQGLK